MIGYEVIRLDKQNLADVAELHTVVYGRVPDVDFFINKYNTAFTGVEYVGYIAYDQQIPIAFYGVIPCFLSIGDETILSAQSTDTMTHPDYRNKGLFVELAERTYQLCIQESIRLIFGFPNQNSLPGFVNKLGWEVTGLMDCFILKTGKYSWQRVFRKAPAFKDRFTKYQQSILEKHTEPLPGIDNSVFKDGFDGIVRDQYFLNYKTYTHKQVIKIGSSRAWVKINNVLLIGDMDVWPGDFVKLITQLKKLARKLGVSEMHFQSSRGTMLHELFARQYKAIPSFPVIIKQLMGYTPADKIKFTSADIDTF